MDAKAALQSTMGLGLFVLRKYFEDFTDAELMERPGPGCNHLAWQLGHLIGSEVHLVQSVCPHANIALPEGFTARHSKETSGDDDPRHFDSKQTYLDLLEKVRVATSAALAALPDADLDKPAPERMRSICPTVGDMFVLIGTHPMMHAGQFVSVRRRLGKPVVI